MQFADDGSFVYAPNPGFSGTDSFVYVANDGFVDSLPSSVSLLVNATPVALEDAYETEINTNLVIATNVGVLANDSDIDLDPLSATLVDDVTNGTLELLANGSFTYTPNTDFTGIDSFTYIASDGIRNSGVTAVSLAVGNLPPVATDDFYVLDANAVLNIDIGDGILGNDNDPEGDALDVGLISTVSNGELTLNPDGSFLYTPNENFNGLDVFTYIANDFQQSSEIANVRLAVGNQAPEAVQDNYTAEFNELLEVNDLQGVLSNDTDFENAQLSALLVSDVSNGELAFNSDGSFTYTPGFGFQGIDEFTYAVTDGIAESIPVTVVISVSASDTDLLLHYRFDDSSLIATDFSGNGNDGSFSDTPVYREETRDNSPFSLEFDQNQFITTESLDLLGSGMTLMGWFNANSFPGISRDPRIISKSTDSDNDIFSLGMVAASGTSTRLRTRVTVNGSLTTLRAGSSHDLITGRWYHAAATFDGVSLRLYLDGELIESRELFGNIDVDSTVPVTVGGLVGGDNVFDGLLDDVRLIQRPLTQQEIDSVFNISTPPVSNDDNYAALSDATLTINETGGVLSNDTDADGDELTAVLIDDALNGELNLSANGSFTYTPNPGFNSFDSFTYLASDGENSSSPSTVTILVGNQVPVAQNDSYVVSIIAESRITSGEGVLVNDSDINVDDTLTAVLVDDVENGNLELLETGAFIYDPFNTFFGVDSFTYVAFDGELSSSVVTVTLIVNDPAFAVADTYNLNINGVLLADSLSGVLANDTDNEGDELAVSLITDVAFGTLDVEENGAFSYTPDVDFNGIDTFVYSINDGVQDSNTATVSIVVGNQAPVGVEDFYFADINETFTVNVLEGLLSNDTDNESDELSVTLVSDVSSGSLTLNDNGSFTYLPAEDFRGSDTFSYIVSDQFNSSEIVPVVIYTGDQVPVAVPDVYTSDFLALFSVNTNQGVLANDSDVEGQALTALLETGVSNGTLTLNSNGSFAYLPDSGFVGLDTFSYRVSDGANESDVATVSITVQGPVPGLVAHLRFDDGMNPTVDTSGNENHGFFFGNPQFVSRAVDGSFSALEFGQNGVLNDGVNLGPLDLNGTGMTLAAWFNADSFPGENRDPRIISKASSTDADADYFQLGVARGGNDTRLRARIRLDGQVFSLRAEAPYNLSLGRWYHGAATYDGTALRLYLDGVEIASVPLSGTIDTDPTVDVAIGSVPGGGLNFDGIIDDARILERAISAEEILEIVQVNSVPLAVDDLYVIALNAAINNGVNGGVLANDIDSDSDTLTASVVTTTEHGDLRLDADGSFRYTPADNFNGIDSFTYVATDGENTSAIATATIVVGNFAPEGHDDEYVTSVDESLAVPSESGVLTNDTDINSDELLVLLEDNVSNGALSLSSNGSFFYTPNEGFVGVDVFSYIVSDGVLQSLPITVTLIVNDAPLALQDEYFVEVDAPLSVDIANGVLINDTDPESDVLTARLTQSVTNGVLEFSENGSFVYEPSPGYTGVDRFRYVSNDGFQDSTEVTVLLYVGNQAPVALNDEYESTIGESLIVPASIGLLNNDSDIENSTLSVVLQSSTTNGVLSLSQNGGFSYVPNLGFENSSDSFTYFATDGELNSEIATVTILVGNQVPVAVDDVFTTTVETELSRDALTGLIVNDSDADGDLLTVNLVSDVENGSLTLNSDGSFSYTPNDFFIGTDAFTYSLFDGDASSNLASVTINVIDGLVLQDLVYAAETQTVYKEYWIDHEWFTGADECANPNNPPTGGIFFIEPEGGADRPCSLFFDIDDDISSLPENTRVEVFVDIWRGRSPSSVRFSLNDGAEYASPVGDDWSRTPLVARVPYTDIKQGINEFKLWVEGGLYHVHDIAIRLHFNPANPILEAPELEAVDLPAGSLVSITDENSTHINLSSGGQLQIDNDEITISAFVTNEARFVEFHAYYDGYDVDNDGNAVDWHHRTRHNLHEGGLSFRSSTGGTIDHVGTVTVTSSGVYSATWDVSNIRAQSGVRFKIRLRDINGNVVDAAGGVTGEFELTRLRSTVDIFRIPNFQDAGLHIGGNSPPTADRFITLPDDLSQYDEAVLIGSYWNDPNISINGNESFTPNDGTDRWRLKSTEFPISFLNGGENLIHYFHTGTGFGEFIEKPGPMIVLRSNRALRPVAVGDQYIAEFDESLVIDEINGVLNNDIDLNGNRLISASLLSPPANGQIEFFSNGSFSYTPNEGFAGIDSFTYVGNDGSQDSNEAVVSISVGEDPLQDLLVHLEFDDGRTPATDSSNSGNDGVINGAIYSPNNGDGSISSLSFDGVDDSVDVGNLNVLASGLTLAAWIYPESFYGDSRDSRIISKATGVGVDEHVFMLSTVRSAGETLLRARIRILGVTHTVIAISGDIVVNEWQHVAMTFDGERIRLYLDGAEVGVAVHRGSIDSDSDAPILIGAQPGGTQFFDGFIDDVRILQRPLTANELSLIVSGNNAPVAVDDVYSVLEDTGLNIDAALGVLANDSDPDFQPISAVLQTGSLNGSVVLETDGSFSYTPNPNYFGVDSFTYVATDLIGNSNESNVLINITGTNDDPVSVSDFYQAEPSVLLAVESDGVLENDIEFDNQTLEAVLVQDVENGVLNLQSDGTFTYLPDDGFSGTDTFTYVAVDSDSDESAASSVFISVASFPVANDDNYSIDEDTTLTVSVPGIIGNDIDTVAPSNLTASLVVEPENGDISLDNNGSFEYTPDANFNGEDFFTYSVADPDSGASVQGTVNITVDSINDAPVAVSDTYFVGFNTVLVADVRDNDVDIDGDLLTVIPENFPQNGTLFIQSDGRFTYTPFFGFSGGDVFTYRISDGEEISNLATVIVAIESVQGLGDDLLAHFQFDNGLIPASDSSGNNNEGIFFGAEYDSVTGDGSVGSIRLDGLDDRVDLGVIDAVGEGLTVAAWFNASSFPGSSRDPRIVSKATGTRADDHIFMLSTTRSGSNTVLRARLRVNGDTTTLVAPNIALSTGLWNHAAFTHDGTVLRLYLNGFEVASADLVGSVDVDPTVTVSVGSQPGGGRNFDGFIDDVRIYRRAISESEVESLFGGNGAPIANSESYLATEDTVLVVSAQDGVLPNDSDPDNQLLTTELFVDAANGSVVLETDGSFTYTPNQDFSGLDTFSYRASDGELVSNESIVTIDVAEVNDAPSGVDDVFQVQPDSALSVNAPGVLENDLDPEGGQLQSSLGSTDASNGSLTLNSDGSFDYQPDNGFEGTDTFSYIVSDSVEAESPEVLVTIRVIPAPETSPDSFSLIEDGTLTVFAPGVITNDVDVNGPDNLVAVLVSDAENGTVVLESDGGFTYTPSPDFAGTDTFVYQALDPITGGFANETVTIEVGNENDIPVAVEDLFVADFETELVGNVLSNDLDPDADGLVATLVSSTSNGVLTLQANGTFTYIPNNDFFGNDSFVYFASDNDDVTDETVANITVNSFVPDEPDLLVHYSFEDGDQSQATDLSGYDNHGTIFGAQYVTEANDGTLRSLSFDGNNDFVDVGAVDVTGDGLTLSARFRANSFPGSSRDPRIISKATSTSANDHIFMLGTVNSGGDTRLRGRIRINGDTTTLVASGGNLTLGDWYHAALVYDGTIMRLLLNGSEVGSAPLTGSVDVDPTVAVTVGAQGSDKYFDGLIDDVRILQRAITNDEVNDILTGNTLPQVSDDNYSGTEDQSIVVSTELGVLANDIDSDNQLISASLVDNTQSGVLTLNIDGSFTYTPNSNFSGFDSFTYQASDGIGLSQLATVTLSIAAVNDPPIALGDEFAGAPNEALVVGGLGVLINDVDPDGDSIEAILSAVQPQNGSVSLDSIGSFIYTPNQDFGGSDSFSYVAVDSSGLNSAETTVVINIVPLPVAVTDSFTLTEDDSLSVSAPGVLENDTDVSGPDDLVAELVSQPDNGSVTLQSNGSLLYTPFPNFNGIDTFIYSARDPVTGGVADSLVLLNVANENDVPSARDDNFVTNTGVSITDSVLSNDTDLDGDELVAILVETTLNGQLDLQQDGTFTYEPNDEFNGTDTFTYQVSDGLSDSSFATVSIVVIPDGVTDPDLLVHLLLDDGADPATDSSGSGNNASLLGPVYVEDTGDNTVSSLSFDGIETRAELGNIDVNGSGITMAAWFRANSFPGSASDPRIISKASGSAPNAHTFMLSTVAANDDVRLRMRVKINGQTRTLRANSGNLETDRWYHAAATYDGITLSLYLDGEQISTLDVPGSIDVEPSVPVAIGAQPGGGSNFDGLIDDVRLLQRPLTAQEIESIASGSATADPIPTQPGELVGVALSENRIELDWLESTDNFGVVGYEIYRDSILIATVTETSFTDTNPIGGIHLYEIEAIDADGFRSTAATVSVQTVSSQAGLWWDLNWPYRVLLGVASGEYDRTDRIVELPFDFDQAVTNLGGTADFDSETLRCHEVDSLGGLVGNEVPCQVDHLDTLVLLMPDFTPDGTARYFHLYFDEIGGSATASAEQNLVELTDNVVDEGQSSYRIDTEIGTYFYHKQGAGFSSLNDTTGIDWIGYNEQFVGALGTFRGIPNMVPPEFGGFLHPGSTDSNSEILGSGPIKTTIRSETNNGLWEVQWDIYPHTATLSVLRTDANYWVLYEGVPGGFLDAGDSTVRSAGGFTELSAFDSWGGDLEGDEWVYVTASELTRSFYMAHLDQDFVFDSYRPASTSAGQMTILGFGRQNSSSLLNRVPERFTMGLINTNQFSDAKNLIESTIKPIDAELSSGVQSP